MNKTAPTSKKSRKKLSVKERKFIASKIKGASSVQAYKDAGYAIMSPEAMQTEATRINKRESIQLAIDQALAKHEMTPDVAVHELSKIVKQDKELGAKRLAIKDVLELHGYKTGQSPTISLDIKSAWFNVARPTETKPEVLES
jgi:phage terminase small subunit